MRRSTHFSADLRCWLVACLVTLSLLASCRSHADPAAPQNKNPHSVTISWAPSKSAIAGYIVYRISSSGKIERLTKALVAETKYTDATVQGGQTYSYYVTSVDAKGVESKPSDKITATVPTAVTPPVSSSK